MPGDKPRDASSRPQSKQATASAAEWGRVFFKRLRLEFAETAADLPRDATHEEFGLAMVCALNSVFAESGIPPEQVRVLLADWVSRLSTPASHGEWSEAKNARRLELIDKSIQGQLSQAEAAELDQLTACLRATFDTEEMVPLEGAKQLHQRLLDQY